MRMTSNIENDKVRILNELVKSMIIRINFLSITATENARKSEHGGVWIESVSNNSLPKVNDLLVCATSGIHNYTVGFCHEVYNPHEIMIREIGTNKLCKIHNEMFYIIHGLYQQDLWEGIKYDFFRKVVRTISKYGDGWNLYHSLEFIDDQFANVHFREKWTNVIKFTTKIQWNRKRLSMKKLWKEIEASLQPEKIEV